MMIFTMHLMFMIIMYGQINSQVLDCITASTTGTGIINADCPDNRTAVSCGYRLVPEDTTMDFGSFPFDPTLTGCSTASFGQDVTAILYSRCCDLSSFASCAEEITFEVDEGAAPPRPIEDTIQTIGCSADSQLFGCGQGGSPDDEERRRRLPNHPDVIEVGVLGAYPSNSTQPPPQGTFDLDNICTSHRTSSLDHPLPQFIGTSAICCNNIMPDSFSLECIGVSSGEQTWNGNDDFSVQCPDGLTMTDCNGYSPFNLVNGAYIADLELNGIDQCVVQRINDEDADHYSVATAVCCQVSTPSPITTDSSDSSDDSDSASSDSDSLDDAEAFRRNEKQNINEMNEWQISHDVEDSNKENETVEIKFAPSLQQLLWIIAICCMIVMFGWVFVFKSTKTHNDHHRNI